MKRNFQASRQPESSRDEIDGSEARNMMKDKKRSDSTDRRNFLKLAGLGSIAGGAALATGVSEADAKTAENKSSGYRETDHVKSFYKSARF